MTFVQTPGVRPTAPADGPLPPASPRQKKSQSPEKNSPAAQDHVLASTSDPSALRNIKDERPAGRLHTFSDGTPIPPNPFEDDFTDDGPPPAASTSGLLSTSDPNASSNAARKSSLVASGALPAHVDEAFSSIPLGSDAQLLAFSLVREIGASLADARQYASEDIPVVPGKSEQQTQLEYCLGRTAGLSVTDASGFSDCEANSDATHFREAARHPHAASTPSVKVNYCVLRAFGMEGEYAKIWADIGPNGGAHLYQHGFEAIRDFYEEKANLTLSPGIFPRFVGDSIPAADGKRTVLGKGGFNEVELLRIIDPRSGQERNFAFKPSTQTPSIGLGAELTEIKEDEFFPETRNLAAVAVARTLGLTGDDGVTGDAFMGIVDDRLGLFMEVAPGKPMAAHHYKMKLDRNSRDYARLTKPAIKKQLKNDPEVNAAQSKILGVHSIRFEGKDVLLAGSVTDPKHPDTLEPFRNNNPSLKKAYARVEFFDELINESDCHAGNIIVEENNGRYCARRIDLDQSFGLNTQYQLDHENSFMPYYLPIQTRYLDKELADRLRSPGMRDAMEASVTGTLVYDDEIEAFMDRFDIIVAAIDDGEIEVIDNDDGWRAADMSNPLTSLFARDGQRPTFL